MNGRVVAGQEQVDALARHQHRAAQAAGAGTLAQGRGDGVGVVDRDEMVGGDIEDHAAHFIGVGPAAVKSWLKVASVLCFQPCPPLAPATTPRFWAALLAFLAMGAVQDRQRRRFFRHRRRSKRQRWRFFRQRPSKWQRRRFLRHRRRSVPATPPLFSPSPPLKAATPALVSPATPFKAATPALFTASAPFNTGNAAAFFAGDAAQSGNAARFSRQRRRSIRKPPRLLRQTRSTGGDRPLGERNQNGAGHPRCGARNQRRTVPAPTSQLEREAGHLQGQVDTDQHQHDSDPAHWRTPIETGPS